MEIVFLGTRGEVDVRSRTHRRHSSLLVRHGRTRVVIDCGADWLGRLADLDADAVIVTHAHPDHAAGLRRGAPCPVYASRKTLALIRNYALSDVRPLTPRKPLTIGAIRFEAFPVVHSYRAPALGVRVSAGNTGFFYVPDLVAIPARRAALWGIQLYIGDGASLMRPLIRKRPGLRFGHASIKQQLEWCRKEHVRSAIFTHCGTQIIRGDPDLLALQLRHLGEERGVDARFAHDGMRIALR
jgi:phosphoribosyl 1,2-cyclic phosphodiesterase